MHVLILVLAALVAIGCSTPEESCEPLAPSCDPQYEPTFDNIHSRTLTQSCATSGSSCHATPTSLGGFSLSDPEVAYGSLSARAEATECGVLAARITSDDPAFQMPPGMPLSEGEQCAILMWIEAGAPR